VLFAPDHDWVAEAAKFVTGGATVAIDTKIDVDWTSAFVWVDASDAAGTSTGRGSDSARETQVPFTFATVFATARDGCLDNAARQDSGKISTSV